MGEYGNPDIVDEWAYLRRHSPYHLLRHDILGMPEEESPRRESTKGAVLGNTGGGHGGAADNEH